MESSDGADSEICAGHVVAWMHQRVPDRLLVGYSLDGTNETDNVENLVALCLLLGDAIWRVSHALAEDSRQLTGVQKLLDEA